MKKRFLLVLAVIPLMLANSFVFAEEKQQELSIEPPVFEQARNDMKNIASLLQENPKEYYEEYMQVVICYSDEIDPPETIYNYYTDEEVYLIQKCVETEAHDADFISKVNVANVILNRIESDRFPNTVQEVITSPKQFAYGRDEIANDTKEAVEFAFMFEDTTNGALFFQSVAPFEKFNGASYIFTDDIGHHFYK